MAIIKKSSKPLSVNPLKTNACSGATLAYLGIKRTIPLLHSAQGCSAFAKVFFVRHFREPIPLQNTAMDHVATVMNADDNLIEALHLLASKQKPDLIGVATSGLAETQGADVGRIIKTFRTRHPELADTRIVWVSTPDFRGGFEQGYADTVYSLIDQLVPASSAPAAQTGRVNLLCPAWMTPGDQEALAEIVDAFGLTPVLVPNLADSLDGHLGSERLNPVSQGGIPVSDIEQLGSAQATLVLGRGLREAGDLLATRTGVPSIQLDQCLGLEATDQILLTLAELSSQPVPAKFTRQRQQLQDAFLDCHFMLTGAKVAIAAEPDHLGQLAGMLNEVGAITVSAVTPSNPGWLEELPLAHVTVGDLEDWEDEALAGGAQLLLTNSHGLQASHRLGVPLQRVGFPQYDWLGGYQRVWLGYRGARQALFDLGNLWTEHHEHTAGPQPHLSRFRNDPQAESCCTGAHHEHTPCLCQ